MKNISLLFVIIFLLYLSPLYAEEEVVEEENPCPVEMGYIEAFGYTLKSDQISNEDFCSVEFLPSPNERWTLIVYNNYYSRYVVWLYDSQVKSEPKLVTEQQYGRHMLAKWYGNDVFTLNGAGMGYDVDHLFSVYDVSSNKEFKHLIKYCHEYDVYVDLITDYFDDEYYIEVGRFLDKSTNPERFSIDLFISEPLYDSPKNVQLIYFDETSLIVRYKNTEGDEVIKAFESKVVEKAIESTRTI